MGLVSVGICYALVWIRCWRRVDTRAPSQKTRRYVPQDMIMMRKQLIVFAVVLLMLPWGLATAQKMYKWVDSAGNVSDHDTLPPDGSDYKAEEKQFSMKG